jgi:hypothetical protein
MLSYQSRGLAIRVAVTAIIITAVVVGLLYSGLVTNLLPRGVSFGE